MILASNTRNNVDDVLLQEFENKMKFSFYY